MDINSGLFVGVGAHDDPKKTKDLHKIMSMKL